MSPLDALCDFAEDVGWQVRSEGDGGQLIELDHEALVVVATLTTRRGGFPVRLIFRKLEVPDVVASEASDFQAQLSQLKKLEAFRQFARL